MLQSRKYKIALTNAIAAVVILLGTVFGTDISGETAANVAMAVIAAIAYVNGQNVNAVAVEDAAAKSAPKTGEGETP